jgi:hypothetical protein
VDLDVIDVVTSVAFDTLLAGPPAVSRGIRDRLVGHLEVTTRGGIDVTTMIVEDMKAE